MSQAKEKVLIAMSGGVDSSVSAHSILQAGYDAIGATMRLTSGIIGMSDDSIEAEILLAKDTCRMLNIDHLTIDLCDEFKQAVVDDFVSVYMNGGTPNPCIICNKKIKFGSLLDTALKLGCDKLATGHYARIERTASGRYVLKRALDHEKDQSYMLWSLSQQQLSKVLLPLGSLTKAEVRQIAESLTLKNAHKKDSQDVCFIPSGDYAGFIENYTGLSFPSGKYIDDSGNVLGKSKNIIHYTIGQRKGLGIALGQPMFVLRKSAADNTVTLCDGKNLFDSTLWATNINLIATDSLERPTKLLAKARYRQEAMPATVVQTDEETLKVVFDNPIRAISPGQSVVLYDGDTVVGGGIIK